MAVNTQVYNDLSAELYDQHVQLVAVSKTQSIDNIKQLYDLGQRHFGENYVQELVEKQPLLPPDIQWHFIGHLQSNKVKYIVPFVHLIQSVDSLKLLSEINKQAGRLNKTINCLLQVHIAQEETKFGLSEPELNEVITALTGKKEQLTHVSIKGLMGMASFSDDHEKVRAEMKFLNSLFDRFKSQNIPHCDLSLLSMGMSSDYSNAIQEGSNMVRVGSLLFGARLAK